MWGIVLMFLSRKLTISPNVHSTLLCDSLYKSYIYISLYKLYSVESLPYYSFPETLEQRSQQSRQERNTKVFFSSEQRSKSENRKENINYLQTPNCHEHHQKKSPPPGPMPKTDHHVTTHATSASHISQKEAQNRPKVDTRVPYGSGKKKPLCTLSSYFLAYLAPF